MHIKFLSSMRALSVFITSLAFLTFAPDTAMSQHYYRNPILAGDYPDPTILREGDDYYMTHSSFNYLPGLQIFHSKDLVHWEAIGPALTQYLGAVWAPDMKKYNGLYYIYFTVAGKQMTNYVVTAKSPYGPWSAPKDLELHNNIDPCHIATPDGKRYLFLSKGDRCQLTDDGLSVVPGTMERVYPGWQYPADWITEDFCLEGPKIYHIGHYYYLLNAQGGTAGPPTSHMVVVARSKSIDGPWENMPTNPLVHTNLATERWWSRGHGSIIDTPDSQWHIVYHAYENGFTTLGRQTLLEPIHFTADGWLAADGGNATYPLPQPTPAWVPVADNYSGLADFKIGTFWRFFEDYDPSRFHVEDRCLTLVARGNDLGASSPLLFVAGARSYEFEAEITISGDVKAGLTLFYNDRAYLGHGFDGHTRYLYKSGGPRYCGSTSGRHLWLRLKNDHHIVTGYWSEDGKEWHRETWGANMSGFDQNTLGGFLSLLPGLFVHGDGEATFSNFQFRYID